MVSEEVYPGTAPGFKSASKVVDVDWASAEVITRINIKVGISALRQCHGSFKNALNIS